MKQARYETLLFTFGFVPIAFVFQEFLKQELYEECNVILNMIKKVNTEISSSLPTTFDDETIEKFIEENNDLIDFSIALNNMDEYVSEIKKIAFKTA